MSRLQKFQDLPPREKGPIDTTMDYAEMEEEETETGKQINEDPVDVGTSSQTQSNIPKEYLHLPEEHWKKTRRVVAQNLLFEYRLLHLDLLKYITPKKL